MRNVKQQISGGLRLGSRVEPPHLADLCYTADHAIPGGRTTGRTRNHTPGQPRVAVKSLWLYPLCRGVGKRFAAPTTHTV